MFCIREGDVPECIYRSVVKKKPLDKVNVVRKRRTLRAFVKTLLCICINIKSFKT